ncbi:lipoate--protein ligase family protein [Enterococcus mundtii]|uniref:lipoate--protein ligase family protein n=1 Tax=Enterococcus TaxID=1350 RepID=UPI0004508BF2|nr:MULTISPECIES: lipoate--protein ligase family protein [Enterococcus]AZP93318.1 lipoate--protein ligase family protein [Enterococcus mundtii]EYT96706.1 lipoate-protein ligase A [Enterococcus mundtii CRL35]MDA9430008.1 Lipoate-protein ligase A [Enterococcus mundtii 1A]MDK4210419.1 lipoate--protein ligase family protein [Enterococcus mundtii]MDO7879155.1 lipoate--protein ligase family protein [Enterococcus mundtii]
MTSIILDQEVYHTNDFSPFALTDILTENSKKKQQTFLHFWQYQQTVILGMKDTRTSFLADGIKAIQDAGFTPVIRNAGGLGVVSDRGILNISLIFPQEDENKISIDEGYEKMLALTRQAFPVYADKIKAYEIKDSYCPGTYDLSIDGKKFAGIAQRRIKNGISVMMYLSVNGDQERRGELMRRFYQQALKEQFGTDGYPAVRPTSMATLEELFDTSLTIVQVKDSFIKAFDTMYPTSISMDSDAWQEANVLPDKWQTQIERMNQRNALKELAYDNTL